MTALAHQTVLDYFKSRRNETVFQFLTWYMLLVRDIHFDDIIEFVMKPTDNATPQHTVYVCYFTTKTGLETVVTVEQVNMGGWYCTGVQEHQINQFKPDSKNS